MAFDVARHSLYRASINLWVEDRLTGAYLDAVWNSPIVAFFIGGGNEGVQAIVNDAEKAGCLNVFAVIDRDFRRSNKPNWLDLSKSPTRLVLPVHEIENYLLDAAALAASRLNNLGKTEPEIEVMMATTASRLCWWAACRDVVAEMRQCFRVGFLGDPACTVSTEDQARDHICQSPWFQKLPGEISRTTMSDVQQLLSDAYRAAYQSIGDGRWRTEFAGKEILHDVASRFCHLPGIKNYRPGSAQFDEDLAKEVGAWQRLNNAVPADLTDLLVPSNSESHVSQAGRRWDRFGLRSVLDSSADRPAWARLFRNRLPAGAFLG